MATKPTPSILGFASDSVVRLQPKLPGLDFFSLPREIRDMIYNATSDRIILFQVPNRYKKIKAYEYAPNLLNISRQFRSEVQERLGSPAYLQVPNQLFGSPVGSHPATSPPPSLDRLLSFELVEMHFLIECLQPAGAYDFLHGQSHDPTRKSSEYCDLVMKLLLLRQLVIEPLVAALTKSQHAVLNVYLQSYTSHAHDKVFKSVPWHYVVSAMTKIQRVK